MQLQINLNMLALYLKTTLKIYRHLYFIFVLAMFGLSPPGFKVYLRYLRFAFKVHLIPLE